MSLWSYFPDLEAQPNALQIGDSVDDIECAEAAGCQSVFFLQDHNRHLHEAMKEKASHVISDLIELKQIVDKRLNRSY